MTPNKGLVCDVTTVLPHYRRRSRAMPLQAIFNTACCCYPYRYSKSPLQGVPVTVTGNLYCIVFAVTVTGELYIYCSVTVTVTVTVKGEFSLSCCYSLQPAVKQAFFVPIYSMEPSGSTAVTAVTGYVRTTSVLR